MLNISMPLDMDDSNHAKSCFKPKAREARRIEDHNAQFHTSRKIVYLSHWFRKEVIVQFFVSFVHSGIWGLEPYILWLSHHQYYFHISNKHFAHSTAITS